jgi:hypothetical protein
MVEIESRSPVSRTPKWAQALGVMRFLAEMVEAIGEHHTTPGRHLLLGRLIASTVALEVDGDD